MKALVKHSYSRWVAVEQDSTLYTPFKSHKMSRDYLRKLGY